VSGQGRVEQVRSVRVGLVVDEALSRATLAAVLDADPRVVVVHVAAGCAQARARIRPRSVDVLVVDAELGDGNGVALSVQLQRRDPRLTVLLLSAHDVTDLVLSVRTQVPRPWSHVSRRTCADAGALVQAVVATAHGHVVLGPGTVRGARAGLRPDPQPDPLGGLTEARTAVLRLVAQGLSNRTVARMLGLSDRSVENHLGAVYRALGATGPDVNPRVAAVLVYRRGAGAGEAR
jgi:DNA-binding NarL/FixJ family response regulator